MARARNWRDVRADAIQAGLITEEGLAEARRQHDDQMWEAQSAVARRSGGRRKATNVSQSRVSRVEKGDIEHVEVATLDTDPAY